MEEANGRQQRLYSWAQVDIVGIKDASARGKRVPMLLRRWRKDGPAGEDPLCAYDALRIAWASRQAQVPVADNRLGGNSFYCHTCVYIISVSPRRYSVVCSRRRIRMPPCASRVDVDFHIEYGPVVLQFF
eukprot:6184812-Pleurochrysis_carterae.AAC.1